MRDTIRGAVATAGGRSVAYVLGYVLAGSAIRESDLNQIVEALGREGVVRKIVGWVFYNAHGATTTLDVDVPLSGGTEVVNYVVQLDALSSVLYVIPPALMLLAGLFAVRAAGATDFGDALTFGPAVAVGYLPLVAVGAFLLTISVESSSGGPTLVPAIGLAGLLYPLVFGTIGTLVAVWLSKTDTDLDASSTVEDRSQGTDPSNEGHDDRDGPALTESPAGRPGDSPFCFVVTGRRTRWVFHHSRVRGPAYHHVARSSYRTRPFPTGLGRSGQNAPTGDRTPATPPPQPLARTPYLRVRHGPPSP